MSQINESNTVTKKEALAQASTSSKVRLSTKEIAISGLLLALAFILSNIKLMPLAAGGSIAMISMIFVSLIGYWFGAKVGLIAALAYGFLQLALGGYVIHPVQMLFDYPIAFMCLGFSGLFRNKKHGLAIGFLVGNILKYLCHVFTGVVFFSEAGASLSASLSYSLVYNAYVVPEVIITLILIPILLPVIYRLKITTLDNSQA
ncbi:MAG: energy-coupled thiamine transporter ThiT [Lachnospiraceae bacterium]|nr:energy-coupled thiamine transporter ThiT [Lachnospiraceae bacterium]